MVTPQENLILTWMEKLDRPVSDTEVSQQFPRLWPGWSVSLLQHTQIERDRRHYRITSVGRKALVDFGLQGKYEPFRGRAEI